MWSESTSKQNKVSVPLKDNALERSTTYTVGGKSFRVTPIFKQKKESAESLGSVLLRLMKEHP